MSDANKTPPRDNTDRAQHYVPCAYLKRFSQEPSKGRNSAVWIYDGTASHEAPVKSICRLDYFYSLSDPEGAERKIRENIENPYEDVLSGYLKTGMISNEELQYLFHFSLYLHARSPKFRMDSAEERIEALTGIAGSIAATIEPLREDDRYRPRHYLKRLTSHFEMRIYKVDEEIFTSDDPCLMFRDDDNHSLAVVILLPLTPFHFFVAVRADRFKLRDSVPSRDCQRIMGYEVMNRLQFIIGRRAIGPGPSVNLVRREPANNRSVTDKKVSHNQIPYQWDLTFIAPNPEFDGLQGAIVRRQWGMRLVRALITQTDRIKTTEGTRSPGPFLP